MLISKAKPDVYYLMYNFRDFKRLDKNTVINREVYTASGRIVKPSSIIKYVTFNVKQEYSMKQISEFIQVLSNQNTIIIAIFNPKIKEIFLLFISNKEDLVLKELIKTFIK